MKTLFLMILTGVFLTGHLIAPNMFQYDLDAFDVTATPLAGAETSSTTSTNTNANQGQTSVSAVTAISTPVPTAVTDASETTDTNDPTQIFGSAKVEDVFDRGSSGFGLSAGLNDDENIRIIALNNRLSLEPKKNNGWISWRLRPPTLTDGAVEMDFSIITCARGDRTGIMMRTADYTSGRGYYFSLSCEGTVSILKDSTVIGTADARGAFKNNSGDINTMTALIQGNQLTLILNGQNLLTTLDDSYNEGYSGFFTAPQGQNTLTMDILTFNEYYPDDTLNGN